MKNVGNSSDGRSQGVPKISGHPCIGCMGALRSHLCDSTAFLLYFVYLVFYMLSSGFSSFIRSFFCVVLCDRLSLLSISFLAHVNFLFLVV